MQILPLLFAAFLIFGAAAPAQAHEFWIEPERYTVAKGKPIIAHLRVGEKFAGGANAYIPEEFVRFDIVLGGAIHPVTGRLGDIPALNMTAPGEGLAVIVHETRPENLRYMKWEKFARFARHKDFAEQLQQHKARGLPESDFMESYRRLAKSLVAIGNGRGRDTAVGLETEFVLEANPYTDDLARGLPLRLLYKGMPRPDAQVEVFEKPAAGEVGITLLRTNAEGGLTLPVKSGATYLLDAVIMRPLTPSDTTGKPVWETLWAAITFQVPPAN